MASDRFKRVKEIFSSALDLPPEKRGLYLDKACHEDKALRSEVEALLKAHNGSDEFMEAMKPLETALDPFSANLIGAHIGQCILKSVISSGGMGTVYEAQQEHPRRIVAVKVMKIGILSPSSLRRFEHETQILGNLQHPGIAQIFESGTYRPSGAAEDENSAGLPYFVMEYIPEARPLTEYARDKGFGLEARLRLYLQVLEAVHHGHQKGIIHRDLKPDNILVDGMGHVKVIDFGVARVTDSDLMLTTQHTAVDQLIGTVQYMSPEQCRADPKGLDLRSDVYALGVVLYELCCEEMPYDLTNSPVLEATRRILEEPPKKPSTTSRSLRGDIETIMLKALEKERERRYASAEEMRRDIDSYLSGKPITARPPSTLYQLKLFTRRNKALVSGVAAAFVALLVGFIISTSLYFKATRNEERAKSVNAFFNQMLINTDPHGIYGVSGYGLDGIRSLATREDATTTTTVAGMIRRAIPLIEQTFQNEPELEATVHNTMGATFYGLTLMADAEPQLRKAYEIRCAALGEDHLHTLESQILLGQVLRHMGRDEESHALISDTLERLIRLRGEKGRTTLRCMRMLAFSLSDVGERAESNAMFEKVLRLQREVLGDESREYIHTLCEYGIALISQSRWKKLKAVAEEALDLSLRIGDPDDYLTIHAEILLCFTPHLPEERKDREALKRQILKKCLRLYGEQHVNTANAQVIMAKSVFPEDRRDEQEELLRKAYATLKVTTGVGGAYTNNAQMHLLMVLAGQGKAEAFERFLTDWLNACRESLGEDHIRTRFAVQDMAFFLLEKGRFEESDAYLEQLLDSYVRLYGEESRWTWASLGVAAKKQHEAGRHEKARELVNRALTAGRKRLEEGEATFWDLNDYARLLLTCEPTDLRDYKAALPLAAKAVEMSEGQVIACLETMAMACSMNNDQAKAVEWQKKAVALLHEGIRYDDPGIELQLARYLIRSGEKEKGLEYIRDIRERVEKEMGDRPLGTIRHPAQTACMLLEEGYFAEAEPLLLEVVERRNSVIWKISMIKGFKTLIRLYERWGKEDEARVWQERLNEYCPAPIHHYVYYDWE